MNILVVGGRGYLGSLICNLLCQKHNVTSIDLGWFPSKLDPKVKDIQDDAFNLTNLEGYDSIIYVAGISNDPVADIYPRDTFANNVGLPFHLAKLAKFNKVKNFIYASSCSVYGWKDKKVTEEDEESTISYYGTSKLLGERVKYLASDNFNVVILRMGTLSGVSPRMRFDLLMNTMYASLKRNKKIIVNTPDIWRAVIHVQEAAKVYQFAVESNVLSGTYNLSSFNCTVLEAAQAMQKHFGGDIEIQANKEVRNYAVDNSKINKIIKLESTLDTIASDLKQYKIDNVDLDQYYNIKTYQKLV